MVLRLDCCHLEHFNPNFIFAGHCSSVYRYEPHDACIFDTRITHKVSLENLGLARFGKRLHDGNGPFQYQKVIGKKHTQGMEKRSGIRGLAKRGVNGNVSIGSVSTEFADEVFRILLEAYDDPLPNEMDWILEAFLKILDKVSGNNKKTILECATEQIEAFKPSTKKRAEKIVSKQKL